MVEIMIFLLLIWVSLFSVLSAKVFVYGIWIWFGLVFLFMVVIFILGMLLKDEGGVLFSDHELFECRDEDGRVCDNCRNYMENDNR